MALMVDWTTPDDSAFFQDESSLVEDGYDEDWREWWILQLTKEEKQKYDEWLKSKTNKDG